MCPMKIIHNVLITLLLLFVPLSVWSATTPSSDPISSDLTKLAAGELEIDSDSAEINTQEGTITYSGNVVVSQKTRKLTGNTLIIYRNAAGDITKVVMKGTPVHYRGQVENKPDIINAYASSMEYDLPNELLYLRGNARIERDGDIYQAPEIQYDVKSGIASSVATPTGRTHITIDPESIKNEPKQ